MGRFQKFLEKLIFPKLPVVLISVPAAAALLIYTFAYGEESTPIAYVAYFLSAYATVLVCVRIIRMPKEAFRAALHRNPYVHRYLTDIPFKTHISLYMSLGFNLLFVAMKLFYSVYYGSLWFAMLSVYYVILAVMRFLLLNHVNRRGIGTELATEWKSYRLCGMIMLPMNIALFGVVMLVVKKNESFQYTGYLIYIVAIYAFYSIITAAIDVIKYRKYNSPVMSASKAIKLATALVSMLSLETAMLMQFGTGEHSPLFRQVMTAATGGVVCTFVLAMAVYIIIRSTTQLIKLKKAGTNTLKMEEGS